MEGATLFRRLGLLTGIDRGPVVLGKKLPGRTGGQQRPTVSTSCYAGSLADQRRD